MTPVGHSLTGLVIAVLVTPREWPLRSRLATMAAMVLLANAPDVPLPRWGHDRYDISHSVFVSAAAVLIVALVVRLAVGAGRIPTRLYIAGGLAWFSHLLLDTTYNHGRGIAIYWPFGDGRLALTLPWFSTMNPRDLWSAHNFRVWAIEAVVYGSIFALAVGGRRLVDRRKKVRPLCNSSPAGRMRG